MNMVIFFIRIFKYSLINIKIDIPKYLNTEHVLTIVNYGWV